MTGFPNDYILFTYKKFEREKMTSVINRLKKRNPYAKELLNRQGPYKAKVERDRTKYTRKTKHKNQDAE